MKRPPDEIHIKDHMEINLDIFDTHGQKRVNLFEHTVKKAPHDSFD
jgi:hypothetical protein